MKKTTTFLITLLISIMTFAQYDIDDTQNLTYVDISSTGTLITPTDDGETNITTPWTIYLGGVASTELRVGNNGAVLFDTTTGDISSNNTALSTSLPIIAPFWDDFDTEVGGVYYETKTTYYNGVPIASKFIIQWDRVHYDGNNNSDPASFQVIFNRDSPTIIFQYADVDMDGTDWDSGLSATIGIATINEVSQYSYNTASLNGITTLVFSLPATNVPDDNFETYLETHNANGDTVALGASDSMGNGVLNDDTVPTSRIENVTTLYVSYENISDLTGIEDFTALTTLYCYQNNLSTLDLSDNTALITLNCSDNNISTLDVSNNTEITDLYCSNNDLSTLDLSANSVLSRLVCGNNNLTTLDVSTNTALTYLSCSSNSITSLDVSTNTDLTDLYCYQNDLTALNLSTNTALTDLNCDDNNLTVLDISTNTALTYLSCDSNDLTTLDLTNNNQLNKFDCSSNSNLSTLNIQNGANGLLSGTYAVASNTYSRFRAMDNPNLTCIFVDNATDATNGVNDYQDWDISNSPNTHYVANQAACDNYDTTNVPDDNFEAYLETHNANGDTVALGAADSMGNGTLNDDTVPTSRIENVTSLNVSNINISDLTGIEDFTALTSLICSYNGLTSLDVTYNTALSYLNCSSNDLTILDVSTNTDLVILSCYQNNLTSLNVSTNIALSFLDFSYNGLTSLDLSNNIALTSLYCYTSNLTELDLTANNQLEKLSCSNSPNLTTINIQNGSNNLLSGTYTAGSTTYSRFSADNNPNLTCIFVDNATDATNGVNDYQDWDISNSPNAHYVADQAACDALAVADNEIAGLAIYPNPVQNTLNINAQEKITQISIYNLLGQEIKRSTPNALNTTIDLSNLSNGAYFIKAQVGTHTGTYRIIKK